MIHGVKGQSSLLFSGIIAKKVGHKAMRDFMDSKNDNDSKHAEYRKSDTLSKGQPVGKEYT
jgi:hypothetical protein